MIHRIAIVGLCALGLGGCFERPPSHVDQPTAGSPAQWARQAPSPPEHAKTKPPGSYYPRWPDADGAQTPDERAKGGTSDPFLWQGGAAGETAAGLAPGASPPTTATSESSPLVNTPIPETNTANETPAAETEQSAKNPLVSEDQPLPGVKRHTTTKPKSP